MNSFDLKKQRKLSIAQIEKSSCYDLNKKIKR